MKKLLIFPAMALSILLCAQGNLKNLSQKSVQAFAYRIAAGVAEKYMTQDSIEVDAYLNQTPAAIFDADSVDETKLAKGLYVVISVSGDDVSAYLTGVTNIIAYPINNRHRLQLLVRDKQGNFINDAHVWVNNKEAVFNSQSQSYCVKQKKPDGALAKIYAPEDTTYITLSAQEGGRYKTIPQQRWYNFTHTKILRVITWLPRAIGQLFKEKNNYTPNNIGAAGTMVFNQPKYKQTDTVKLKAYIFDKHQRRYGKPVYMNLEYDDKGQEHQQFIAIVNPSSPGSYIAQFPLSDTLPNDVNYTVNLTTKVGTRIIAKRFKIEGYVLNEVASYNIRSAQQTYYPDDTMRFFGSAKDANGLPLLDATAKLVLTTENIHDFYKDSMYVPDTMFVQKKNLLTQGETEFDVPANILPDARLDIEATLTFTNSNNELEDRNITIHYSPGHRELVAQTKEDTVYAEYRVNGKNSAGDGWVDMEGSFDETRQVAFPFKAKIDPLADKYRFFIKGENGKKDSAEVNIGRWGNSVTLSRTSKGDTLGFVLYNPYKVPVSYTVFDGNITKAEGKSSDAEITWHLNNAPAKKMYTVRWQYWWGGSEKYGEQKISLLYKLLNINVHSASTVFPGQRDSLQVNVTDYHNKPVQGVNLTAVSYNSQFSKDIYVPDPPYLAKYRLKPVLQRDKFETDDPLIAKHYLLGKHTGWVKAFGLDSMVYYQMLFPANGYVDKPTPVTGFSAQVSVNAVSHGQKQQIYMLYINKRLVYYGGVTEAMPYAFETFGGYVQIGMRLYNKFITIDSIYAQPGYKHDLVFDIDNLPANSTVENANNYFSGDEISELESSIMQVDDNFETNYSYIWDGYRTVHLASAAKHLIGPFERWDSLHLFAPGHFDIHFRFEAGYEYNISKQILRLEKKPLFLPQADKYYLPVLKQPVWVLGDTIMPHPAIQYPPTAGRKQYFLNLTYNNYSSSGRQNKGQLQFTIATDTMLRYVVLYSASHPSSNHILNGYDHKVGNIDSGLYTLFLVDKHDNVLQIDSIHIWAGYTFCLNTTKYLYYSNNVILAHLFYEIANPKPVVLKEKPKVETSPSNYTQNIPINFTGKASISGEVIDKKGGLAIAGATVQVKVTFNGTQILAAAAGTGPEGNFIIKGIREGRYVLSISSVGYETKEMTVDLSESQSKVVKVALIPSTSYLQDVVVVGYGSMKKKELTGAVSGLESDALHNVVVTALGERRTRVEDLLRKLPGVDVDIDGNVTAHGEASIRVRGVSSISGGGTPIFIIDGILYHEMPANVTADMISDISVLKGTEAVALYGAAAANGVLVITTKSKTLRQQFRDYAFWQPQLFTDEHGQVKFEVTYPDNTTGWQTYVLGMDKHARMGKAASFVQAYKPVMAELSMPQFLLEGDSAEPVGKALNYTGDVYNTTTSFTLNGIQTGRDAITLQPKASVVKQYGITAPAGDTLKAAFSLQTSTGFKDGEERKIPVFKRGTEETTGSFWVLKYDTTIAFTPNINSAPVELYAQNNTLDILLDEIEHLKNYPYYCMEQTSSKLRGLLMEKKIYEALHKPFTDDKTIDWLVQKLEKAQLYSGGWGWWENGYADINITAYVVKALLPLRDNPLVETSIRNGLLYLQNELAGMDRDHLLSALLAMGEAHHLIDYKPWLEKIHFDSLTQQQQWQYVRIKQLLNEEHATELKWLLGKAMPGMLGSLHWGEDNYRWYGDANATTTLAFEVLQQEKGHDNELDGIIRYFLSERKQGYWVNTVTSASVVSATLPYLLAQNSNFQKPAVINVSGDSTFSITQFPYKTVIKKPVQQLGITKTGGGLVYLTAYQHFFNRLPQPVTNNFDIHTWFEKNGSKVAYLTAGEKVTMVVQVNVLKEAEYVMMEIPIPAGCLYADKNQSDWQVHKEFMKNKAVFFSEHLSIGTHTFTLDLESRYNGVYTLNPAKASLMYFPTFYGRNDMKRVEVR